jgi:hypothetical protein
MKKSIMAEPEKSIVQASSSCQANEGKQTWYGLSAQTGTRAGESGTDHAFVADLDKMVPIITVKFVGE